MRYLLAAVVLFQILVVLVLPALVVRSCDSEGPLRVPSPPAGEDGLWVRVLVDPTGATLRLPLEEYVKGVVAAEMPASFDLEALKAQAVVARTCAVRRMRALGGAGVPGGADVRTSVEQGGQAWLSRDDLLERWGRVDFDANWARIEEAVQATQGLIVTYSGLPVDPLYHSTCGGRTENSEDVWQEALPYLRSVLCPADGHSPHAARTAYTFSLTDIAASLGGEVGALRVAAGNRPFLQVVAVTPAGRARTVRVGDQMWRATDFRLLLGLPSTAFTVELTGDQARFQVTGWGHAVGLCQYGADGLARAGKDYRAILRHYYTGVEIEPLQTY